MLALWTRQGLAQQFLVLDDNLCLAARALHAKWNHGDFRPNGAANEILRRLAVFYQHRLTKCKAFPSSDPQILTFYCLWNHL
jgi:hypothetical protein